MSLQIAAKHLASHGRGSDTTLVHMTPGEVASLQSLAQQHGGSLTTNPHTGLPEAGFLSALLPMAAGAGLAAMGMPSGYAALAVGATSALTNGGDLKQGLMNGISAYGGADMATAFMGAGAGAMAAPAAAPVAEAAPAISAAPAVSAAAPSAGSVAGSSMQDALNKLPEAYRGPSYGAEAGNVSLPSLTSAAPAEVVQAAAAATPAAQAAKQAVSLNDMDIGQRWDALKAGATGANAMKYAKENPLPSLGIAASLLTPDENKQPQKAADTDRGPRAGLQYHPGWSKPLPKPNMQGIEQTYNRPYYAAEGGVTHMAEGGITPLLDQKQLFADYLKRVMGGGGTEAGTGTGTETETETKKPDLPFLEAPVESNTRGSGRGGVSEPSDSGWVAPTSEQAYNWSQAGKNLGVISPLGGGLLGMYGNYLARNVDPNYGHESMRAPRATATEGQGEGLGVGKQTVENMGRVPSGISLNDFADNYRMYGEGAMQGNGAYASPVPSFEGVRNDYAVERGAYLPGTTLNENLKEISNTPSGPVSVGIGALSSDPATRAQELANRDAATERAAISAQAGNGGGGHDWGGGGQGAATGGNNGDASGGGDRGTRGGFAQGGDIHGGLPNPYDLGSYSDGGRLLKGPGDGVSDSIPATIGKGRPARLANNEFVIPARIVSEIGNGSTDAGARALYKMMDRVQQRRSKTVGRGKVAVNSKAYKELDKL